MEPVETETYGDHTVNVWDDAPSKADYRIELLYKGEKVREMVYPAYRIYTFLAHWKEMDLPTEKAT